MPKRLLVFLQNNEHINNFLHGLLSQGEITEIEYERLLDALAKLVGPHTHINPDRFAKINYHARKKLFFKKIHAILKKFGQQPTNAKYCLAQKYLNASKFLIETSKQDGLTEKRIRKLFVYWYVLLISLWCEQK